MPGYIKVFNAHIIWKRCASSQKKSKPKKYSNTICLPSTKFPLWLKSKEKVLNDEKIEKVFSIKDYIVFGISANKDYIVFGISTNSIHGHLQEADFKGLYTWQRNNVIGTEYILHDGPPYANGPAHIGHAINKVI